MSSKDDVANFYERAESFRKKIRQSMLESRVDDLVAERMLYVVDYLDVLLQGFFAFQDVLWERFGASGKHIAEHLGQELEKRLQYIEQTNLEAIRNLPEQITSERVLQALEASFPKALAQMQQEEDWHNRFRDHLIGLYAQVLDGAQADLTQSVTRDLQKRVLSTLRDSLQKSLDTEIAQLIREGLQPSLSEAQVAALAAALQPHLADHLASTLQAHLQAHPLQKSLNASLNAQSQALQRSAETYQSSLDALHERMQVQEDAFAAFRARFDQATDLIQKVSHLLNDDDAAPQGAKQGDPA